VNFNDKKRECRDDDLVEKKEDVNEYIKYTKKGEKSIFKAGNESRTVKEKRKKNTEIKLMRES
jgi:hypothetical protein